MSLCIDDRLVCRFAPAHQTVICTVTYTRWRIDTINSPDDGHMAGARGGAVGLGTALQAGRSRIRFPMVSLVFFP